MFDVLPCDLERGEPPVIESAGQIASAVLLSRASVDNPDPYAVIESNLSVVNYAREDGLLVDELHPDAVRSYFVDFWIAQCRNGGFAQFVYNARSRSTFRFVDEGLAAMGATGHHALYRKGLEPLRSGDEGFLQRFFERGLAGRDRPERDTLNAVNEALYALAQEEDLNQLHHDWLVSHPDRRVLTRTEMADVIDGWVRRIPDPEARARAARLNRPLYVKLCECLSRQAGLSFEGVVSGEPRPSGIRWFFRAGGKLWWLENDGAVARMHPEEGGPPVAACRYAPEG